MRWRCGVRTGTTKTELRQRTSQPKLASRNRPQVIAVQEPSIAKVAHYRRRQEDVICRRATPLLGRVTLCVSRHLGPPPARCVRPLAARSPGSWPYRPHLLLPPSPPPPAPVSRSPARSACRPGASLHLSSS